MENKTAAEIAQDYLKLGGTRKSAMDDNLASTRKWDAEPEAAMAYWQQHVDTLQPERRREVESLLPSISPG